MVISDFIHVQNEGVCFPKISRTKDLNHKTYDFFDKKKHPKKYVDNTDALFLIKRARNSFLSHTKLKDKHMKKKYLTELSSEQIKIHFYLSRDKKFYCFYFNITDDDAVFFYVFGIIEKSTGKHLMFVREFWSGSFDACYIKHNAFDYYTGDKYMEKTNRRTLPVTLSNNTKEILDDNHKPLDIIDSLEDYFLTLYEELSELN
ncbi:hypothetical protein QLL95_gp0023 [Cotonvirus japonicus]|uniref:Uncharacterized protein n=1 Tax=Cotonvirus japonicus TaxID=2811091 RepID=A0ABM7NQS4_9VIRU|nr:hypothetical protein QLL95_gp0023 [Cotonvirus japonicus]BCS82512.1 hypothetical protein [Cotonvirus japonicus]